MNQIAIGRETEKTRMNINKRMKYKYKKSDNKLGPFETIPSTERKQNQLMKMIDDDIDLDSYIKRINEDSSIDES